MITALVMGVIVGAFGDQIEARARRWKDSKWAVLAAFLLLGMVVALVVTAVKQVF